MTPFSAHAALAGLLFAAAPPLTPDIPDLVPGGAVFAFGVRSVADLKDKGDGFLKAAAVAEKEWRITRVVEQVYDLLGLSQGVDERGRVVLLVTKGQLNDLSFLTHLALAVPFTDLDTVARNFRDSDNRELRPGGLKRGVIQTVNGKQRFLREILVKGRHLYLASNRDTLETIRDAGPVGPGLAPEQRDRLGRADLVMMFRPDSPTFGWRDTVREAEKALHPADETEARVVRQLVAALESVQMVLSSARIEESPVPGLAVRFEAVFPGKVPPDVAASLKLLQASGHTGRAAGSDLRGLPTGPVIAAHAARADGATNAVLARLVVGGLVHATGAAGTGVMAGVLDSADAPLVTGVFSALWRRVNGRRLALYQNTDPDRHGLFSLVTVLDTPDPRGFVSEIGELARLAAGKDLDLSDKGSKADRETVQKLVADLASDEYAARENATTRLTLIGEPALPFLEKAAASEDLEVKLRARRLLADIRDRAARIRKELLDGGTLKNLRPGFVLSRGAGTAEGVTVDEVAVKLDRAAASAVAPLRSLFGPDWARIRLAVVGRQVVVLVGSDEALFRQAVRNLKAGAPGLADAPALKGFARQADPGRLMELHVAPAAIEALTDPAGVDPKRLLAGKAMTSLAVTVDASRFGVNIWTPPTDFERVLKGVWLFR